MKDKTQNKLSLILLLLLITVTPASSAASIITNGSFELATINPGSGFIAVFPGQTSITGWNIISADVHYIGTYWEASDGIRSIDLDGGNGSAGGVSQTFATIPGTTYTITFDMAGNPENQPTIKPMRVSADGQSQVFTFDITGHTKTNMGWTPMNWSFIANDASATLQFQSLTTFSGWGPAIDNVSVNPVTITDLSYTSMKPCRIVDTRKTSAGIIRASTQRNFRVFGSGGAINAQGGNPAGCPSPGGTPYAAHINMVAVDPTGKGNLQAFPVGAGTGAGLSVNYNTIDTNLANAGTVKTVIGSGADITVASNFSSAHTAIDVLGYYYPDGDLLYTAVKPCRIVDTRKTSAGIIDASTQRNFRVFGSGGTISAQGGNTAGCSSPLGEPLAAHINMVAVTPTGKGNLQAFPVGAGTGAGLSVNYNTIDTNLANAGTVGAVEGDGPDITVASNFASAHTVIDVLGYYYPEGDLLYTPVKPCRIIDTRKELGPIEPFEQRIFRVFGSGGTISAQGGNPAGCPSPGGEPLAVHINMVAVNPTGKGNLQAFPVGAGTGAGLSVNYNTIDTNLANAGTVKAITGTGPDITVASNFASADAVVDVLGYYYPAP